LYVLYEGYGYSVSSLYSLGFVAGAFTSPFIGPIVDKIGRKKAAMLYCVLEMFINYLELFPIFAGLIASRVIGGITTNLLFSVFESWLVSEHRSRGFGEEKLETILRDSTIVSNSAAILSGYLAHCLATNFGAVGPFQGAVVLTCVALILVWAMWTENYGTGNCSSDHTTWKGNMGELSPFFLFFVLCCLVNGVTSVVHSLLLLLLLFTWTCIYVLYIYLHTYPSHLF